MSRRRLLSLVLLAAVGGVVAFLPARPVAADAKPLPSDLAFVPTDAVGFAHVRAADVWAHPEFKPWRAVFEKAGRQTIDLLDARFAPKPSTTDRVTFVVLPASTKIAGRRAAFDPFNPTLILHFCAPFDKEQVKKAHAEKSRTKAVAGREVVLADRTDVAMAFADDRTLVLGDEAGVTAILESTKKDGPLAPLIRAAAAGGKPVVAGVNVKALPIPAEALAAVPDEFKPLTDLETVSASIDLAKEPVVSVRLKFPNAESATTGEKALRKLSALGRVVLDQRRGELSALLARQLGSAKKGAPALRPLGELPEAALLVAGLGGLNFVDDLLAHPPVEREGAELVSAVTLPGWTAQFISGGAVAAGLFMPAVQKVREAAEDARAVNNLKQIGIALHAYHDVNGHLPPAAFVSKKGKKLYSWRVAVLPYLEQNAVYQQYKLDEPWDSESNKKLSDLTIPTYADPRVELKPAHTIYKVAVGNGALFDAVQGTKFAQVTDGLSNTLMVLAGGDPVPWAKPDDFDYDPKKDFPADYAKETDDKLTVLLADGSVRTLNLARLKDQQPTLRNLIERADGNAVAIED